jgi:hypothetical protein
MMVTTGSKFFFAVTTILGTILSVELVLHLLSPGAYLFGLDTTQAIVMTSAMVACAFLGFISIALRDSEATGDPAAVAAARPHVSSSLWPAVTGVAVTLMAFGLVTDKRIFGLGLVALLASGFEWMIQGWSDRASGDAAHNAAVRSRFLHPIEFPVLGFLVIAAIMFGFSRIMLSLTETGAIIAFAVVGAVILIAATALARRTSMSRNALSGVLGVGFAAIVAFAVIGISRGEHVAAENVPEVEKKATNAVANKANTIASVNATDAGLELRHDGQILQPLLIPRALTTSLLFRNDTGEKAQLVVESVKVVIDKEGASTIEPDEFATGYIGEGKSTYLTVNIPKASHDKPYNIKVVTESGKTIAATFEVR